MLKRPIRRLGVELLEAILIWVFMSAIGISIPLYLWWPNLENWHVLIIEGAFAADLAILFFYLQDRKDEQTKLMLTELGEATISVREIANVTAEMV